MWERSWKAKTAPCIWVARGRLCPDGGALWGRAQPNRDSTPPIPSAPLYRLNHSIGVEGDVGGTGEPREQILCSAKWGRGLVVPPLRWIKGHFASVGERPKVNSPLPSGRAARHTQVAIVVRQAVDDFIHSGKKGPKHGICRRLEWQRKASPVCHSPGNSGQFRPPLVVWFRPVWTCFFFSSW